MKRARPVNLVKREVQRLDLFAIACNLSRRLGEVAYAYDKARRRIAELESRLAEREGGEPSGRVDPESLLSR